MLDLDEMMERHMGRQKEPTLPLPEAQQMELLEYGARYHAGNQFKVGDWVMPAKSSPYAYGGRPWLVLELGEHIVPFTHESAGSSAAGQRLDTYVVGYVGESVNAFWQSSWMLVPYVPD